MKPTALQRQQQGYALITSILFLVLLTIVALSTLKSSGLEARMGANSALHAQAFESSESTRYIMDNMVDESLFNRGWPVAIGGTVANTEFDPTITTMLNACGSATTSTPGVCITKVSSVPRNWFSGNSECGGSTPCASFPNNLDLDATYTQLIDSHGNTLTGNVYVYKLNTTLAAGEGTQQVAGYLGLGRSSAAGGGYVYFYINSRGHDFPSGSSSTGTAQASVETQTILRDTIRN